MEQVQLVDYRCYCCFLVNSEEKCQKCKHDFCTSCLTVHPHCSVQCCNYVTHTTYTTTVQLICFFFIDQGNHTCIHCSKSVCNTHISYSTYGTTCTQCDNARALTLSLLSKFPPVLLPSSFTFPPSPSISSLI